VPEDLIPSKRTINLDKHKFEVALSFPGEIRNKVEQIAIELERKLGPNKYFYDFNYKAQLARPELGVFLQKIYAKQSRLVVVFFGGDYQKKDWCGIEFRAIRTLINERKRSSVMLIKIDDKPVEGINTNDGFIKLDEYSAEEIAELIRSRIESIGKGSHL